MSDNTPKSRQKPLATMVLMGIQRSAPTPMTAEYLTTGVYVQELPSGADG